MERKGWCVVRSGALSAPVRLLVRRSTGGEDAEGPSAAPKSGAVGFVTSHFLCSGPVDPQTVTGTNGLLGIFRRSKSP